MRTIGRRANTSDWRYFFSPAVPLFSAVALLLHFNFSTTTRTFSWKTRTEKLDVKLDLVFMITGRWDRDESGNVSKALQEFLPSSFEISEQKTRIGILTAVYNNATGMVEQQVRLGLTGDPKLVVEALKTFCWTCNESVYSFRAMFALARERIFAKRSDHHAKMAFLLMPSTFSALNVLLDPLLDPDEAIRLRDSGIRLHIFTAISHLVYNLTYRMTELERVRLHATYWGFFDPAGYAERIGDNILQDLCWDSGCRWYAEDSDADKGRRSSKRCVFEQWDPLYVLRDHRTVCGDRPNRTAIQCKCRDDYDYDDPSTSMSTCACESECDRRWPWSNEPVPGCKPVGNKCKRTGPAPPAMKQCPTGMAGSALRPSSEDDVDKLTISITVVGVIISVLVIALISLVIVLMKQRNRSSPASAANAALLMYEAYAEKRQHNQPQYSPKGAARWSPSQSPWSPTSAKKNQKMLASIAAKQATVGALFGGKRAHAAVSADLPSAEFAGARRGKGNEGKHGGGGRMPNVKGGGAGGKSSSAKKFLF